MNNCPEFEDRILDYAGLQPADQLQVDAHVKECPGCAEFQRALTVVDCALSTALTLDSDASFSANLMERLPAQAAHPELPSLWPAVFDLIGWSSIAAIGVFTTVLLAPSEAPMVVLAMGLGVSAWVGLDGWRELSDF